MSFNLQKFPKSETSSNLANSQTFGQTVANTTQASVVRNGSTKPPNAHLDFLLSNKKTIIIKNLPAGITAQALSRGGKLPIKFVQQLASQKTAGASSSNILKEAGQDIAKAASSSTSTSVLSYPSGSVISVTMGKDGKPVLLRNTNAVPTNQSEVQKRKGGADTEVIDLTEDGASSRRLAGESQNSGTRSERFLITPLNAAKALDSHKSTLKFNTSQTALSSTPNNSKNVAVRTVTLSSAQGTTAGLAGKMGLLVKNHSFPGRDGVNELKTGYMSKPFISVNDIRAPPMGQTDAIAPLYANTTKTLVAGSKIGVSDLKLGYIIFLSSFDEHFLI